MYSIYQDWPSFTQYQAGNTLVTLLQKISLQGNRDKLLAGSYSEMKNCPEKQDYAQIWQIGKWSKWTF